MTWRTIRTARKGHRCENCGGFIERGTRYIQHDATPDHVGNTTWWRMAECAECARRYGRPILEATA